MSTTQVLRVLTLVLALSLPVAAPAQTAEPVSYVAEVNGDRVYVRSGPSQNYYPVNRLDAGARVRVVGAEGEWAAIEPPTGCFSLISETYVDTGDNIHGVVNGHNVRVRVGSLLSKQIYAVQLKLAKGAEVEILGREDNGYYRIVPPAGARLWMHQDYLTRVPDQLLELEQASTDAPALAPPSAADPVTPPAEQATAGPATPPGEQSRAAPKPALPDPAAVRARIEDYRSQVEQIDVDLKAELAKPLPARRLRPIMERFRPLAEQETDAFTRAYAEARIAQVSDLIDLIDAVQRLRNLREEVKSTRQEAQSERANIRPRKLTISGGFDAEGELRFSAVYDSPAGPQRYRLVDPSASPVRTVGYVEVPRDSSLDVSEFLGRRVGVRAREVKFQTGEVNPIAIYVLGDLVSLDSAPAIDAMSDDAIVEHP